MKEFDYIIIGGGCAGLSLAYELEINNKLKEKTLAIIETRDEYKRDKTWSFWKVFDHNFEDCVIKSWNNFTINSSEGFHELINKSFPYQSINSEKFYKKIHSSKLNFAVACSKKLNFYHDFNDATKIYSKKNIILDIGKNIEKSNGFDAGFFIINTKKLAIKKVSSSISENLKFSSKKICRLNIENDDWIDLDTKTDIKNFRIALKKKIFTL